MTELSLDSIHKCKMIGEINSILLKYDQEQIGVEDFDILYSLDIEDLRATKQHIKEELQSTLPVLKKLKH